MLDIARQTALVKTNDRDSHTFITLVAAVGFSGGIYRRSTVTFVTDGLDSNCEPNGADRL